jgi:hypothetical protein
MIHRIVEHHIDRWMQQYLQIPLVPTPLINLARLSTSHCARWLFRRRSPPQHWLTYGPIRSCHPEDAGERTSVVPVSPPTLKCQCQAVGREIQRRTLVATHPLEQRPGGIRTGRERREGALVLGFRRRRRLEACPVRPQNRQALAPDVRPKDRDLALRLQRKEKVVSIVEHSPQDRLDQEIIGIDQHVVGLKTRKRKDQMQAAILILEGVSHVLALLRWLVQIHTD